MKKSDKTTETNETIETSIAQLFIEEIDRLKAFHRSFSKRLWKKTVERVKRVKKDSNKPSE